MGLVVIDLDNPLKPRLAATVPLSDARASAIQFRYLWVTDRDGLKVFDVTRLDAPRPIPSATVPIADARKVYLARTYAYVDGLNLTGITDSVTPANSNVLSYSPASRLAAASGAWGSNSFSYDGVGNRLSEPPGSV